MKSTLLITVLLTTFSAFANQTATASSMSLSQESLDHLTIASSRVEDVTAQYPALTPAEEQSFLNEAQEQGGIIGGLTAAEVVVDKIINIGTKIWNIVEKGKPVVNISSIAANALPEKTLRWDQLQNWARPTSKVMSVTYTNLFGFDVVTFTYRVVMLYGGNVEGIGRYIGYAKVEPLESSTAWGYNFSATAKVDSVFNMGSSKNPLAGMILNISWTVKTVLKSSTETDTYTLDGNGRIATPPSQVIGLQ